MSKVVLALLFVLSDASSRQNCVEREVEPFLIPVRALLTQAHRGLDDGVVELSLSLCQ